MSDKPVFEVVSKRKRKRLHDYIHVVDDWCSPVIQNMLVDIICNKKFVWETGTTPFMTSDPETVAIQTQGDPNVHESNQVVHPLIINGEMYDPLAYLFKYHIESFLNHVWPNEMSTVYIERIKVNMMFRTTLPETKFYNAPHVDPIFAQPRENTYGTVALYYPIDSDGDTFFFNCDRDEFDNREVVKRVTPKAGRMVLFDNSVLHCSSPPQEHPCRLAVNSNIHIPKRVDELIL